MEETKILSIVMPYEHYIKLKKLAKEGETVSSFSRSILIEYVNKSDEKNNNQ
jgi:hypothetical protein